MRKLDVSGKNGIRHFYVKGNSMGTRGTWAVNFLRELGNNSPSEDMIKFVSAWTKVENTAAQYNPLATTLAYGDTSDFNSVGVKNYKTYQQGIEASALTLNGDFYGYAGLKQSLIDNDTQSAIASGGLDTWGSHTSKVALIYAAGNTKDEELLSDKGTSAESGINPNQAEERIPKEDGGKTRQGGTQGPSITTPQVTENDIRNISRMVLGVLFVVIGTFVFISVVINNEKVQSVVTTAAKVTL